MRTSLLLAVCATSLVAGCGDDDPVTTGGTGGGATSTSTSATSTSATGTSTSTATGTSTSTATGTGGAGGAGGATSTGTGCQPTTCEASLPACGKVPDGCGGTLECECPGDVECGQTRFPQAVEEDDASGDPLEPAEWGNLANGMVSDDKHVKNAGIGSTFPTSYVKATAFGFEVPEDATVKGILVEWEKKAEATDTIVDSAVRLVSNGFVQPSGDKKKESAWETFDVFERYGGENDVWGLTAMPNSINAEGFGTAISAAYTGITGTGTAYVDSVRVTIYYSGAECVP